MSPVFTNQYLAVGRYRGENYAYSEADDDTSPAPRGTGDGSFEPVFFKSLPAGTRVEVIGPRWKCLAVRVGFDGSMVFVHPSWLTSPEAC